MTRALVSVRYDFTNNPLPKSELLYHGLGRVRMTHRILVPFELPDADPVSRLLVEDFIDMEVVAFGH